MTKFFVGNFKAFWLADYCNPTISHSYGVLRLKRGEKSQFMTGYPQVVWCNYPSVPIVADGDEMKIFLSCKLWEVIISKPVRSSFWNPARKLIGFLPTDFWREFGASWCVGFLNIYQSMSPGMLASIPKQAFIHPNAWNSGFWTLLGQWAFGEFKKKIKKNWEAFGEFWESFGQHIQALSQTNRQGEASSIPRLSYVVPTLLLWTQHPRVRGQMKKIPQLVVLS